MVFPREIMAGKKKCGGTALNFWVSMVGGKGDNEYLRKHAVKA